MGLDEQDKTNSGGRITRSPSEIARVLEALVSRQVPVKSYVRDGALLFVSRICRADPAGEYIIVESSPDEQANAELISRPRCAFFTDPSGWHVEFVATAPKATLHGGNPAIQFRFPEVLSNVQTRDHSRASGSPTVRIHCIADEGGFMPFEGWIVDASVAGIGFLTYDPTITLEPGTILKECRMEAESMAPLIVDLEVRYSELVSLPDGTQAKRSGCRFVEPPAAIKELIGRFR
jgi:flagellar brake protein